MKMKWMTLPLLALLLGACGKNTDSIGEASTVFNLLGKNDRIEIEAFDDPDVHGVSCFLSYAKKGGLRETVNLEEDASDASVSCVQTAPQVTFNERVVAKPRQVFKRNASFASRACKSCVITMPNAKPSPIWCIATRLSKARPKIRSPRFRVTARLPPSLPLPPANRTAKFSAAA